MSTTNLERLESRQLLSGAGEPDYTFADGGFLDDAGNVEFADTSGIYFVHSNSITRYTVNGKLDATFADAGVYAIDLLKDAYPQFNFISRSKTLALPGGGFVSLVAPDGDFAFVREGNDGHVVRTLGDDGLMGLGDLGSDGDDPVDFDVQPDGGVIFNDSHRVTRIGPDGKIDTGFGDNGIVQFDSDGFVLLPTFDRQRDVFEVLPDGSFILCGGYLTGEKSSEAAIKKFDPHGGAFDRFGTDGIVRFGADSGAVAAAIDLPDNTIIAAYGTASSDQTATEKLIRLSPRGKLDPTFASPNVKADVRTLTLDDQGRIYVSFFNTIVRFNADGTGDDVFGQIGIYNHIFTSFLSPTRLLVMSASGDQKIFILNLDGAPQFVSRTGRKILFNATARDDFIEAGKDNGKYRLGLFYWTRIVPGVHTVTKIQINSLGGDDYLNVYLNCPAVIDAGAGRDFGSAHAPALTLIGGEGDDAFLADGPARIYGGNGDDSLTGSADRDRIFGDAGNDTIDGGRGSDVIFGGDGNDRISGGRGADRIDAEAGNDTIDANGGNDSVQGGPGADQLYGRGGDDSLDGGDGPDSLWGGGGIDTFIGGAGNDRLHAEDGVAEKLFGDNGIDLATADKKDVLENVDQAIQS